MRVQPARLRKITKPERSVAEPRDPHQLVPPPRSRQPGIQADLDIHVIVRRP